MIRIEVGCRVVSVLSDLENRVLFLCISDMCVVVCLIFESRWLDMNIVVFFCLGSVLIRLCMFWIFVGLSLFEGLLRISRWGWFSRVCVMLICWCMFSEYWLIW